MQGSSINPVKFERECKEVQESSMVPVNFTILHESARKCKEVKGNARKFNEVQVSAWKFKEV